MNMAKSAKAVFALGATLIVVTPFSAYAGIEGSNTKGIEGSNVRGIEGSNTQGIEGSNIRGIEGSNIRGIEGSNLLFGPIDEVDVRAGTFVAMGQTVLFSARTEQLQVGAMVSVQGTLLGPGHIYADRVVVSSEQYVPGSTEVFVTGIPSAVDTALGRASIGGLEVDYTSSMSRGYPAAGSVWTFRGTQPNVRGLMVAEEAAAR